MGEGEEVEEKEILWREIIIEVEEGGIMIMWMKIIMGEE